MTSCTQCLADVPVSLRDVNTGRCQKCIEDGRAIIPVSKRVYDCVQCGIEFPARLSDKEGMCPACVSKKRLPTGMVGYTPRKHTTAEMEDIAARLTRKYAPSSTQKAPMRRKNPVTATAAQVFEKARQSGYPTQGFTAQQLVDAMWPNGEVRLRGSGAKVVRRGRTHSALQERKMVGNPRDSKATRRSEGVAYSKAQVRETRRIHELAHRFLTGGQAASRREALQMAVDAPRTRSWAGEGVAYSASGVYYTKTGQPYVKGENGRPRFISRAAASDVTHEDLVDAGLRWNPEGLVWRQVQTTTVLQGRQRLTVGSRWAAPGGWEIERVPVPYSHHDYVFQLRSTRGALGDFPSLHEAKKAAELF